MLRGFAMGSADIVPGVSGGTVALVLGIYERLIAEVRTGAGALRLLLTGSISGGFAALRRVSWVWLVSAGRETQTRRERERERERRCGSI